MDVKNELVSIWSSMTDLILKLSKSSESWYGARHSGKHTEGVQTPGIDWLLIRPQKDCIELVTLLPTDVSQTF